MENPFVEEIDDLLGLDNIGARNILDASVVETIKMIEELGKTQYEAFVTERLEKRTASLYEPIKRSKLALFSSPPSCKEKSKDKMQTGSLKRNCSLFACLYVSCQASS